MYETLSCGRGHVAHSRTRPFFGGNPPPVGSGCFPPRPHFLRPFRQPHEARPPRDVWEWGEKVLETQNQAKKALMTLNMPPSTGQNPLFPRVLTLFFRGHEQLYKGFLGRLSIHIGLRCGLVYV